MQTTLNFLMAIGSILAAAAACISTYLSFRSISRIEDHDKPKASVCIAEATGIAGCRAVVVANIGFVPFTVVEVCIGGVPIRRDGMEYAMESVRHGIRTIMPGDHAAFEIKDGNIDGIASVRIADGTVFVPEGLIPRH